MKEIVYEVSGVAAGDPKHNVDPSIQEVVRILKDAPSVDESLLEALCRKVVDSQGWSAIKLAAWRSHVLQRPIRPDGPLWEKAGELAELRELAGQVPAEVLNAAYDAVDLTPFVVGGTGLLDSSIPRRWRKY